MQVGQKHFQRKNIYEMQVKENLKQEKVGKPIELLLLKVHLKIYLQGTQHINFIS